MFAKYGDPTSNIISSEKNLPLQNSSQDSDLEMENEIVKLFEEFDTMSLREYDNFRVTKVKQLVRKYQTVSQKAIAKLHEKTLEVKTNKLNKLRKEADEPIDDVEQEVPQPIKPIQSMQSNISQKDLEAVALNAIIGHEKIRKARKQKKKEAEEVLYQQNLLKQTS